MTSTPGNDDPSRQRAFPRHPARIPLRITRLGGEHRARAADVSHGGLAFDLSHPEAPGTELRIRIPDIDAGFDARARVVWCRTLRSGYRIGVCFLEAEDAYRARMIEQLCAIESYRRDVLEREGRALSAEAAAREWIERFAHRFPGPDPIDP